MAATWWWAAHRHEGRARMSWREKRRIAARSLLAGVAVYFVLLLGAGLYLGLSTP